ncbi:MAG TPA: mannose-1-phosphate guanylyltransferase, partial [Candidatus Acetothermia bacterium]|nr:mannose-1-phosphate guanylyltransferase [Candidatus Acetothermia bacterium]
MLFAVIMAGGRGERLWPLSTERMPKQFLNLLGESTLLQQTVARIAPLVPPENTYIVVGSTQVGIVREQLPELPDENIIVEPMGRGTAPCIGLAATRLSRVDPGGVMIVLPADHAIADE